MNDTIETNILEGLFEKEFLRLQKIIKERLNARLKISFDDLKSRKHYDISGSNIGWAASMIKVPVMIAAFREIDKGNLSLEDKLPVNHTFTLDPTSEISYRPQGSLAEVFELLNYMILASCNESTNMIANRIGIPKINTAMEELNCPNTKIGHLLHVGAQLVEPGVDGSYSNTTTANEMTRLMSAIYQQKAASPHSCRHMKDILENNPEIEYILPSINNYLARGLPYNAVIGAKLGILENDVMETGVINGDYALTIIFNKIPSHFTYKGGGLISGISKKIFDAYYKK